MAGIIYSKSIKVKSCRKDCTVFVLLYKPDQNQASRTNTTQMNLISRILLSFILFSAGCAGTGSLSDEGQEDEVPVADFRATGNEPSWSLEIEYGEGINFTSLTEDYKSLSAAIPEPESLMAITGDSRDSVIFENPSVRREGRSNINSRNAALENGKIHVTRYTSEISDGTMEINILREGCTDDMSGDKFPFSVIVNITDSIKHETGSFKGCGNYTGSWRLNDIWQLDMINGKKISIPGNWQLPSLEIDIEGKTISGYGGCNQFHGRAELVNDRLVTGNIRSTKMACPDVQEIENLFLRTISGKVLSFASSGSTLVISDLQNELKFTRKR